MRHAVETAHGVIAYFHQQQESDRVATAVHEISASVQVVAHNASSAAESAQQTNLQEQNIQQVVSSNAEVIRTLAGRVSQAAEMINQLQAETEGAGTILDVIHGTVVITDEVRTLAQHTQESTAEIQELIG